MLLCPLVSCSSSSTTSSSTIYSPVGNTVLFGCVSLCLCVCLSLLGEIEKVSLRGLLEKHEGVCLVFYPLNFTFVCPTEILAFNKRADEFKEKKWAVSRGDTSQTLSLSICCCFLLSLFLVLSLFKVTSSCISTSPAVSLGIYVALRLSLYPCPPPSVSLSLSLSVSLSLSPRLSQSLCLSLYSLSLYACLPFVAGGTV